MKNFEDFLSEGKKLQIKRKYTENHPAQTVGKTASVRNAVLQAIADGVVTREEFNKILSELSTSSSQWASRNRKYFNVSEDGVKLSKWGRRILAELDETPKATAVNEKIKVTKDKFPYIEFKDGGKKYEVEFDQGDIIDDHGNEGKDWYYIGVDQFGDEWEIDVYTDYRDEPEDWFHDTIKRVDESKVNEAKAWDELNNKAEDIYGEFGFATLDPDNMSRHIDMKKADKLAKKMFGEFGFASLSEEDMEKLINSNPKLVKESVVNEARFKKGQYIKATADSDDFDGDVYDVTNDVDGSPIYKDSSFEIYGINRDEVILWSDEDEVEYSIDPDDLKHFVKESLDIELNEAKFVKEFDKAVLDAETEADVLKVYPNAEFYVGKMSHFFGELEPNLFFKAYYAKYYKEDTGKKIKGDFKITTVYSEKGSRYVNLHVEESAITENYEVIWSDGMKGLKKFPNERKARAFFDDKIKQKGMRDVALYRAGSGFHSTTQTEYVIAFWGDGSYLDNVSKRDKDLAKKKVTENKDMKNEINLFESFSDFVGANFLNESIKSAILRTVLSNGREGKQGKKNLSMLAKGFYGLSKVALDKIEDEDFIISNDVSKIFKNYGGSSHVLFFISDNEKENPYYDTKNSSWNDYKIVPGGGIVLAAMSGDRQFYRNEWSRWSGGRVWSKDKKGDEGQIGINHKYRGWGASGLNNGKRIAEMSDRVIVLNLELIRQKYSTDQLRNARAAAKADATAFKSDKDFKKANQDRYHKILADKAASLPLDKMVSDAIDKLAKQISDGLKKGEKTQYQEIKIGESPKGREVKAKDASQHMSNILDDYARYVDYIRQAEESEARYGERESYYERESKNYAKRVKERINKIDSFDYAW